MAAISSINPPIKNPTAQELAAARKRGEKAMAEEPHVVAATYDAAQDRLSLRFAPDEHALLVIEAPRVALPELKALSDPELSAVEVVDSGGTLLWDVPDVAIGVAALAMRFLGTHEVRRAALREIAAKSSPRKAAAARKNGTLGGRPPLETPKYNMGLNLFSTELAPRSAAKKGLSQFHSTARKAASASAKKTMTGRRKSTAGTTRKKSTVAKRASTTIVQKRTTAKKSSGSKPSGGRRKG